MISFITCSVNQCFFEKFNTSIKLTCKADYEIIFIDNNIEKLSLSEAYNKGASVARFPNLIFVHEDVEFLNIGWDVSLLTYLKNLSIGIVGIAGSTYLPSIPSGWYLPDEKYNKFYLLQGFKYKKFPVRFDRQGNNLTQVYLIDGVFLAMRKHVWQEFKFNEDLSGFHGYDIDISERINRKYQNIFTNKIELLHKSEGKADKSYYDSLLTYKNQFVDLKYPNRNFKLEFKILKSLFLNLRCYYEKKTCVKKIKPYIKIKNLGLIGYFKSIFFIINSR